MADVGPEDGGPRAREWAAGIPAFNAAIALIWARWRRWIITGAGGVGLVWLVFHQLAFWAVTVAALFVWYWFADTPRVRAWLRHLLMALRLRLLPPQSVHFVWRTPAQDFDHQQARKAFEQVMVSLHALPRDVEGDGRIERRKWIYAATEQADGLIIRGDDPFLAIRTRPQSAASAPVQGFVGAAATMGVLPHWRALVMVVLGVAAALLYARGEMLETQRNDERARRVTAEETARGWQARAQQSETDLAAWQERRDQDLAALIEESRQSRDLMERSLRRSSRLTARRAEREVVVTTPGPVDLGDSLRDLAAPASADTLPVMPSPSPGSDPAS
jgi:hypothetical protein